MEKGWWIWEGGCLRHAMEEWESICNVVCVDGGK